jgi:hypothetical protein
LRNQADARCGSARIARVLGITSHAAIEPHHRCFNGGFEIKAPIPASRKHQRPRVGMKAALEVQDTPDKNQMITAVIDGPGLAFEPGERISDERRVDAFALTGATPSHLSVMCGQSALKSGSGARPKH